MVKVLGPGTGTDNLKSRGGTAKSLWHSLLREDTQKSCVKWPLQCRNTSANAEVSKHFR